MKPRRNVACQVNRNHVIIALSIVSAPYCVYQEFLENGTLQDVLVQTNQTHQDNRYNSNGGKAAYVSNLIGFARDISNGLEFLHANNVSSDTYASTF